MSLATEKPLTNTATYKRYLFQYGLLDHHVLLYPSGKRAIDYDALELDVEMMLSTVDY